MAKVQQYVIAFMLYDGRYLTDENKAVCYEVCDSIEEARESKNDYGDDTVIVKCRGIKTKHRKIIQVHAEIVE